jgi:hypothetical protein
MSDEKVICCECVNDLVPRYKIEDLRRHVWHRHRMTYQEYKVKYDYTGVRPTCKCGCGVETRWYPNAKDFATYKSGHNSIGWGKVSAETHKKSGETLKKLYASPEGDKIKEKISVSLKKRHEIDPTYRSRLSETQKGYYAVKENKDIVIATRKKAWADHHDEIVEKFRASDMGHKISLSNMNRDLKHTSLAEQEFFMRLKEVFPFAVPNVWRTLSVGAACYDACIPDIKQGALVEFDGVYWHCLLVSPGDKVGKTQCNNLANDYKKNSYVITNKKTVFRIAEFVDLSGLLPTIESLIEHSHYVILDGEIIKGMMPEIDINIEMSSPTWNSKDIVTEKTLLRYHEYKNKYYNLLMDQTLGMSHV